VREEEGRESVVGVGYRGGGGAEGAGGEGVRAVAEVEETRFEGDEFGAEEGVGWGWGSEGGEAGEEDVGRGLEPGGGQGEDVFGGEVGEGAEEGEGGG